MKALGKGSIASLVATALTVAWWVLCAAAVAWALAAIAYAGFMLLAGLGAIDPAAIAAADGGAQIEITGAEIEALRDLKWTDWQIFVPALLAGGVTIGGTLIIVRALLKLFSSFSSGEPFRRENAHHLRVIWITMVAMELSRYVILAGMGLILGVFGAPDSISSASFSIDSDNFSSWLSILILICLAEVFREGARLKEEQELTI